MPHDHPLPSPGSTDVRSALTAAPESAAHLDSASTTTHRCRMFDEFNLQIQPQIKSFDCRYRPKIIWVEIVTNLRLRELLIMFVLLDIINLDHK